MLLFEVLACGRRNDERTDSPLAAAGPLASLGSAGEAMRLYRLQARREPRLLQTALSGTDADLSQALSQQLCFWTPCGTSKDQAVCDKRRALSAGFAKI